MRLLHNDKRFPLGRLYSGKTNSKTTPKWSTSNLVEVKRLNLPYMNNILIQPPTI